MKKQFVKPQLRELPMSGETLLASGSNPQVGGSGTTTNEQNAKVGAGAAMGAPRLNF